MIAVAMVGVKISFSSLFRCHVGTWIIVEGRVDLLRRERHLVRFIREDSPPSDQLGAGCGC